MAMQNGRHQPLEPSRQRDVFHQRQVGKAADRPECFARDEDCLIAGGDAGQPRAPIDHAGDEGKERMPPGDAQIEATPRAAGERSRNQAVGIVRQNRIGMQEHKRVAGAERCAGIHRRAAVAPDR